MRLPFLPCRRRLSKRRLKVLCREHCRPRGNTALPEISYARDIVVIGEIDLYAERQLLARSVEAIDAWSPYGLPSPFYLF